MIRRLTDLAMLSGGIVVGISALVVITAIGWALNTYEGNR